MSVLVLPKVLFFRSLMSAIGAQGANIHAIETIDCAHVQWAHPSGVTALAAMIDFVSDDHTVRRVNAERSRAFQYLQGMDFFRTFNMYEDEHFNRRDENRAFARLTRIDWQTDSSDVGRNLAKLLIDHAKPIYNDVFTCLEESVQNVIDHARRPGFAVAQSNPSKGGDRTYNIAIADCGRGVRESLSDNDELKGVNDEQALAVACRKGTSGAAYRVGPEGDPTNYGLGLFQVDRIAESTDGRFIIGSGRAIRIRDSSQVRFESNFGWQGTVVEVTLYLSGFREILKPSRRGGKLRFG